MRKKTDQEKVKGAKQANILNQDKVKGAKGAKEAKEDIMVEAIMVEILIILVAILVVVQKVHFWGSIGSVNDFVK